MDLETITTASKIIGNVTAYGIIPSTGILMVKGHCDLNNKKSTWAAKQLYNTFMHWSEIGSKYLPNKFLKDLFSEAVDRNKDKYEPLFADKTI